MSPAAREKHIVQVAIRFFAENGFSGTTRDLADQLGIVHGALYRYFPTKQALLERVYQELFEARFNPEWVSWLQDESVSMRARLIRTYCDYARVVNTYEWVRIFLLGGIAGLDITERYRLMLNKRLHPVVIKETRRALGLSTISGTQLSDTDMDLLYVLHGGIFFIAIRKWIYRSKVPTNISASISRLVDVYLAGAKKLLKGTTSNQDRGIKRGTV